MRRHVDDKSSSESMEVRAFQERDLRPELEARKGSGGGALFVLSRWAGRWVATYR